MGAPSPAIDPSLCPHCQYLLDGLPHGTSVCPECGGSLSASAYALAAARRMARNSRARLALLISPGVGIIAGFASFIMNRAPNLALSILLGSLWLGATIALYCTTGRPGRRRPVLAILLGLPLGIAYFAAVLAAAVIIVLLIRWYTGR